MDKDFIKNVIARGEDIESRAIAAEEEILKRINAKIVM